MALEYEPMRVVISGNSADVEKQFLLNRTTNRNPIPVTNTQPSTKYIGPPAPNQIVDPTILDFDPHVG